MKIYYKILMWNCIVLPWLKLIHRHKSAHWKELNGIYWRMWNSKQMAEGARAMAEFVKELDDVIRRVTTKDDAITTIVSTSIEQKTYKGGKAIAVKKVI